MGTNLFAIEFLPRATIKFQIKRFYITSFHEINKGISHITLILGNIKPYLIKNITSKSIGR